MGDEPVGLGTLGSAAARDVGTADPLAPYVPRLVADWLAEEPERRHRRVAGSLVFADISGFTALTERLAARGKAGAEEMGNLLNAIFDRLLTAAYDHGANLIKWGGDAVLLLFDGEHHAAHAAQASWGMQDVMRANGRVETSRGMVRLGMSIGVHTGDIDFLLVGERHRELVVAGPTASVTAHMEKVAERGQVVLSPATAAALPAACAGAQTPDGDGVLLARPPLIDIRPNRAPKRTDVDLGSAMCGPLRDHLRGGQADHEHRAVTVGFIEFSGTDGLLATAGPEALTEAVHDLVDLAQEAAEANEVTLLATDVAEDGGKIILTSGVPMSAGDDETRILSAVRRIVHRGGRLTLRAGVTFGNVFAGDYGPVYRKTYSVAGDCVNLAARLMGKAEPGQVVTLPAVIDRCRTVFETTALEPFHVKGKRDPIDAVVVGDLRRASEPVAAQRLPLVGRQAELRTLLDASELAVVGRGQVVEIVAPAGIGKSRLIEEVTSLTPARPLWADGDIYGRSTPYQPMQQLLRRTLALPPDVDDATLTTVLRDLVAGSAPDLLPWLPLLGVVAGLELPSTPEVDLLDPGMRRIRVEAVTSDLLGRLLTQPIVFVLNDLQFMDDATVALVRRLAVDAHDRPWLMVATRRPEGPSVLEDADHMQAIELAPLGDAAAEELLARATEATPLPSHRLEQLRERAGGNPLYLSQLVAAATAGADLDELPDSVEGMIAAQIDRLPPRRRRWLRAAAVLGMVVDPDLLRALLAGTDIEDEGWEGLDEVLRMHVDGQLRFTHHLTRLTAYEGLTYRRRTELHARAAEILEADTSDDPPQHLADLLSMHCLHGQRYASAWHYSLVAGHKAREAYAPLEAAGCFQRALIVSEHLPDLSDRELAGTFELLATAWMDLGEMDAAERALRRARAHAAGDPQHLAGLMLRTARQRQHMGRHATSARWVARGRKVLAGATDPVSLRLRAELAEEAAIVRYDQGAFEAAATWARRCVEEARQAGDALTEARAIGVAAVLAALRGHPWDSSSLDDALRRFDEAGDLHNKARFLNKLGMAAYFAGEWDDAVRHYLEAERAATKIGRDHDGAMTAVNLAEVLIQQGSFEDAEAALVPAIRVLRAARASGFLCFALSLSGRAALARGATDEARSHLAEAKALAGEMGEMDEAITVETLLAGCLLRDGDVTDALATVDAILLDAAGDASAGPELRRLRGEALLLLGRGSEGHAELRAALALARKHGARHEVEASLRALLRHGAAHDADEAAAWAAERDDLADHLGVVLDVTG